MSKKFTFITQFSRTPEQIRNASTVSFTEPSKVKTSLSYATDIQTIFNNYCKTGNLPLNGNKPIYDENFVQINELLEAQEKVKEATIYFQTLPTEIRSQYGNSLEKFVKAVHTGDNFLFDKGVLLRKEPVKEPVIDDIKPFKPSIDTPVKDIVKTPSADTSATA